jgi:hypothetical protein
LDIIFVILPEWVQEAQISKHLLTTHAHKSSLVHNKQSNIWKTIILLFIGYVWKCIYPVIQTTINLQNNIIYSLVIIL